jgi:hypothetical protein
MNGKVSNLPGSAGEHDFTPTFKMQDTGGKTAEERNLSRIKGYADFNRQLAASYATIDSGKSAQHLAGTARMDEAYEAAMAAYEAKTAARENADTEEEKIQLMKTEADFKRAMANADPLIREQYLKDAARMDAAYETAMAAYKAKTAPPTPPGSMVETAV